MKMLKKRGKLRLTGNMMTILALLTISACSSNNARTANLAPMPPSQSVNNASYNNITAKQANAIRPAAGLSHGNHAVQERAVLAAGERSDPDCSVKDRFDREALFAYEFGEQQRNRVSFDVDGLNMGSSEIEEVKISFTFRLQGDKPRKERCRYKSNYQGLIGSGYNEMVRRSSGHTVWHEIRDARHEIEDRLGI